MLSNMNLSVLKAEIARLKAERSKEETSIKEGNEMILRFPREIKIQCMKDALEQNNFGMFVSLSRVFLDAPLNAGGIETETIEKIYNDHLNSHGIKSI